MTTPDAALIAEWLNLTGSTTAAKLAQLNAMTVSGPNQDVSAQAVLGYLFLSGKMPELTAYAASPPPGANATAVTAAKELTSATFADLGSIQMSNSAVYTAIQGMLNALAADSNTGITSTDVTALLALAAGVSQPWWQANGFPGPITAAYLAAETSLSGLS